MTRLKVEKKREIVHSKDEIKQIVLEQTRLEGELDRKLSQVQARTE